ncbi:MAG TPA: FecR domain-containing protein [Longimicrobium sp.]|nr:FecR domain-containing protein [Longimicrobium sp.]
MNESDRSSDQPRDDAAWQAVARLLAGESSPDESAALRREMAEHPGRAELVNALDGALQPLRADARADVDVAAALASVMARRDRPALTVEPGGAARTPVRGVSRRPAPWWRSTGTVRAAAAVLVLVMGTLVWRMMGWRSGAAETVRYATEVGARQDLRLPDGSRVVLGPASRMSVAGEDGRSVELDGEAYFEVTHDEDRPFTVTTSSAVIRDLGTAFTVRADSAAGTSVAVTEGVVAVSPPQEGRRGETLRAGDRARVRGSRVAVERRRATRDDVAWTTGRLSFRDAPVPEVVAALRRWYGVNLRVDPSLAGRHLTADFEGQTADQAMRIVAAALGGELRRGGDGAAVVPRGGGARAP